MFVVTSIIGISEDRHTLTIRGYHTEAGNTSAAVRDLWRDSVWTEEDIDSIRQLYGIKD